MTPATSRSNADMKMENEMTATEKINAVLEHFRDGAASPSMDTVLEVLELARTGADVQQSIEKPRRKIVLSVRIGADDWDTLQGQLRHLDTEIARHGELSTNSVSGGYSSGYIFVCDVDGNMTHDKWAKELEQYLEAQRSALPQVKP